MRKRNIIITLALAGALTVPVCAAPAAGYSDVPPEVWYASAASWCQEAGILRGADTGEFLPDAPLTQAMAVTALYRLAGSPAVTAGPGWYDAPLAWAGEEGLTDAASFDPEQAVSLEELAFLLWACDGSPAAAGSVREDVSPWAAQAWAWAEGEGLLEGLPAAAPGGTAARAEAAHMIARYAQPAPAGRTLEGWMDIICGASGIAAGPDGTKLVTDVYNRRVWQVDNGVSAPFAGRETKPDIYGQPQGGDEDGTAESCAFMTPWAIAAYGGGWAVSDADNGAVRLITSEGVKTLDCGLSFEHPTGLAVGDGGELYVADTYAGCIYKIDADGRSGSKVSVGLQEPMGLCWSGGELYAAESGANRVVKAVPGGAPEVVAGSGGDGYADGPALEAQFSFPQGLAMGEDGALYVADTGNSAVRRVVDGRTETLLIRDPASGERTLFSPVGLLAEDGTLYVCDNFARNVYTIDLGGVRAG